MLRIIILVICPAVALCQSALTLSGKVIDKDKNVPLSFASVWIKNTTVGTVTNEDGEFILMISHLNSTDTLAISMMGYASYQVKINEINKTGNLIVQLTSRPIQLSEILIGNITAKEIVKKAFENVELNYPMKPYMFAGFYREMQSENDKSVQLTESAFDIYDKGYRGGSKVTERVDLKNIRASKSYRHEAVKNTPIERFNLIHSALRCNPVRHPGIEIRASSRNETFTIDSVIYLNNRMVYVISFYSYISRAPLFERKNTVHIDTENYIIYKYGWEEYAKAGKYSEPGWMLTKESIYQSRRKRISTIYEYGDYKGKMYLKYFDEKCFDDIYNTRGDSVEYESLGHVTLIVREIKTKNVDKDVQETMDKSVSLAAQAREYDSDFWNNYEQIRLVPLRKKQIKELEHEMPLEEQFKIMGLKK